jgi:hypothetical protein
VELIGKATTPRVGDTFVGPVFSMVFFPFTILGILLALSFHRDLRKRGQARSAFDIAGLWMGYLVLPLMFFTIRVEMVNPAGHKDYGERSVPGLLRAINTAEVVYGPAHSGTAGTIRQLIDEDLLDSRYEGNVSGYTFSVTVSGSEYTATASPAVANAGRYAYFSTNDAVIRYATQAAGACSPCYPQGQSGQPVP